MRGDVVADALAGLLAPRKTLPAKLFYDAEGCRLFNLITELPEYYLTRTELALLERIGPLLRPLVPERAAIVEYGAGSETKAAILLSALRRAGGLCADRRRGGASCGRARRASAGASRASRCIRSRRISSRRSACPPRSMDCPGWASSRAPRSAIWSRRPPSVSCVRPAQTLGAGALFLLGADLRKSPELLLPAYDDAQGVTAAFNRNVLVRLNREAGADFDLDGFSPPDRVERA